MSEKEPELYDLTRRKVLGGITAVGLASAGAGLGTSAYFSDEETFKNNRLTAGALDLKVDWEEHYSDWSDDEMVTLDTNDGVIEAVSMSQPSDDWIGLPDPQNPLLYVHPDALEDFMSATALEAYPDSDNDANQDLLENYIACEDLADTPDDLHPEEGKALRSNNSDTVDENGNALPLVNLHDIKPGDFGELTLSYHLCDNPGYVWLTGGLTSASENGITEPEGKDADEVDGRVELLDSIQTLLWYDEDGDNVYEPGGRAGGKVDIVLVMDRSGSMGGTKIGEAKSAAKNLVDALTLGSEAAQVGLVSFANNESRDHALSTDGTSVKGAIDAISTGGGTNIEGGVNAGEEELRGSESGTDFSADITPSGNDRSDADKVMVVLSDGAPNQSDDGSNNYTSDTGASPVNEASRAKGNSVEMFTIGFGISAGSSTAQTLEDMASDPKDNHAFLGAEGELAQIFGQISQIIGGEECFFRGSLRELLNLLEGNKIDGVPPSYDAPGIPLDGDRATEYPEVLGSPTRPNQGAHPDREAFVDSTTNAIGLAWWLPVDHGNEVQTDSVQFDIGFYTEQARHNDGAGMDRLVPTRRESGWAKLDLNFNGDGSVATSAHARRDNPVGNQALELRNTGDAVVAGPVSHSWQEDGTVESFSYSHDGSDGATFTVGGDSVSDDGGVNPPSDPSRIAIQTKADEATVSIDNVRMTVGGQDVHTSGPISVEASNDDVEVDGRALEYLVLNTNNLDLSEGFEVTGEVSITTNDGIPSSTEAWAFDVVVE